MSNADEYMRMASEAICHTANCVRIEANLVQQALTLPSAVYRPRVYPDGNAWCALYGDNIQDGVCGFGPTPAAAVAAFDAAWWKS